MNLRHSLILAINTSIIAVLFVFIVWLYRSSSSEVDAQVIASMERAAKMSDRLAALREQELANRAQAVAASSLLRGALATRDNDTLMDVLSTIAAQNSVAVAALVQDDGLIAFGSKKGMAKSSANDALRGLFAGKADAGPGLALVLAAGPSRELFDEWSSLTQVEYAFAGTRFNNLPSGDAAVAARLPPSETPTVESAGDSRYYARRATLLSGRFTAGMYAPYAPFWRSFEKKRNSLGVLGAVLFFLGLLLSLVFAHVIETYSVGRVDAQVDSDWQRLLDEVESVRARLISRDNDA